MFVALESQYAMSMRLDFMCLVGLYNIFFKIISLTARISKNSEQIGRSK